MTEPRFDPLAHVDEAADAEAMARRAETLDTIRDAIRTGDYATARRELDAFEAATREAPDPLEGLDEAGTPDALRRILDRADPGPEPVRPLSAFAGRDLPRPVLWMDSRRGGGTVLRAGDVALLSGAGGVGKSFASLALAVAASTPRDRPGEAIGLHVRTGGAVVASFEDDPETMAWRAGMITARSGPDPGTLPEALHVIPDPHPLMTANEDRPGEARRADGWRSLWDRIAARGPALVIVDPASAALAGVNQNDGATVRRFVRALATEAARGGFGVLLVAHSTKAARYGGDPGPGAVAGSGQWWDAARGVLFMRGHGPGRAALECVKANHGPTGWAVTLEADTRTRPDRPDLFAGWRRLQRHSPEEWEAERDRKGNATSGPPASTKGANGRTPDPLAAPDGGPGR